MPIDYDGRRFRPVTNSPNGQVSGDTEFEYHQIDDIVWATYHGGSIRFGTLTGRVDEDGSLAFHYVHVATDGTTMTGWCRSTPEVLEDGRIRLREEWQWTSGDHSAGTSTIEETTDVGSPRADETRQAKRGARAASKRQSRVRRR